MDTSETYIKMCDCPEIQEKWNLGIYDFAKKREWPQTFVPSIKIRNKAWYIWLPRQDQIQEMMKTTTGDEYLIRINEIYNMSYDTTIPAGYIQSDTPEQVWLKYFMYTEHNKIWNGEKWRKNETIQKSL